MHVHSKFKNGAINTTMSCTFHNVSATILVHPVRIACTTMSYLLLFSLKFSISCCPFLCHTMYALCMPSPPVYVPLVLARSLLCITSELVRCFILSTYYVLQWLHSLGESSYKVLNLIHFLQVTVAFELVWRIKLMASLLQCLNAQNL